MFVNCVTLFDNKLEHLVLEYLDHKALVVELGMNKFFKCLTKEEYCIMDADVAEGKAVEGIWDESLGCCSGSLRFMSLFISPS
ncbi:hypothetical protein RO3G_10110 [Rhizopus delemar RA 99-880]|uniref:Uncharacterized protein n=1 Tax=Rhizopus delemar (strain RA 99-880 / ATCC MYA-4621 / FGSC 9543 / NRRL 43880) TaxID=246409 RepID=I1CAC0_RHIO9|nr:hypothetical protein RO3G_10110 [Rhizopus delemar RA 99-880]|eukprot:EIE85400.1 hypothetical protein RO3G_10110 [Rhizopus delemar RA 99-880]